MEKLGEGRQAEVFVWPGGAVKLFRGSSNVASIRLEVTDMDALQGTGIPMPRIFGTVTIEGRLGILMERLAGTDQLSLLGRKPWTIWTAAENLARLHAQLHSTIAPESLRSLKPTIRDEIAGSDFVPGECKELALAALDGLPDGTAVCHFDFHPGNVIETEAGPKVIDWANVRRGHALADVARTSLILRGGALPPGAPFLVRTLTGLGRTVLSWRYLHEYHRLRPFSDKELEPWSLVCTASRLTYGLAEERSQLFERLRA